MLEMQPQKRYTLAAALIRAQVARTLDDLGETLIRIGVRGSQMPMAHFVAPNRCHSRSSLMVTHPCRLQQQSIWSTGRRRQYR